MRKRIIRKGLTLVELAVVVLILGAIITLVAMNISPGELKDDTAALKLRKDANEIPMYLEKYNEKYGMYPSPDQGLSALVEKPTSGEVPQDYKPIVGKKGAIMDPWGTQYILKQEGDDYVIITLGKDKKEGGEGKNADFDIRKEDSYPQAFRKKAL